MGVKVKDLINLIDYNRESERDLIEVCRMSGDWEDYDTMCTSSPLLFPIYEAPIECMGAIKENTIRIDIDWNALDMHRWDDDTEETNA